MCLDAITQRIDNPQNDEREAWKVFELWNVLEFPYCPLGDQYAGRTGKWIKAQSCPLRVSGTEKYNSGFHCYQEVKSAYGRAASMSTMGGSRVIRQIRIRGVRTIGLEFGNTVLVADEMFVPAEDAPSEATA